MNIGFIHRLKEIVRENLANENFGPEDLATKIGMSHSTLHRKIKDISNQTISQFIREVRLNEAKDILLTEEITISEIAYKVGFSSPTYFNKCFHEYFGAAPGEFKKQELEKEPVTEPENSLPKKKLQKIFLFVVAPALIFVSVFLFLNEKYSFYKKEPFIEKSMALLPVNYLGDPEFKHQAEGTWEEIKNNLAQIKDLRVLDRNSVESYRFSTKTEKEIGKELNVGALLKITFQREKEKIILFVNLINGSDGTILFSEKYPGSGEGIFAIQSKIAQTIARELHAQLTPEEKQRIEKIPTLNLTALDFYQRGREEFRKYQFDNNNREALEKAENNYRRAFEYDPTFSLAYSGLAQIFRENNYTKTYFSEDFLDSVLILTEKALNLDNQQEEAYYIRGRYYREKNEFKKALTDINKAIEINPNYWEAYSELNGIYTWILPDIVKAIEYGLKAISLTHGNECIELYNKLGFSYACAGFMNEAQKCFKNAFDLTGDSDSAIYYSGLGTLEQYQGKYREAQEFLNQALKIDSNNVSLLRRVGGNYNLLGNFEKSLFYYQKWMPQKELKEILDLGETHRIALAYFNTGQKDSADKYFKIQEMDCLESIKKNRDFAQSKRAYYDLAAVYAFQGKTGAAYQYLDEFIKNESFPLWWVNLAKDDPLFEKIREEDRFRNMIEQMEQKYFAERRRLKNWLMENDL